MYISLQYFVNKWATLGVELQHKRTRWYVATGHSDFVYIKKNEKKIVQLIPPHSDTQGAGKTRFDEPDLMQ